MNYIKPSLLFLFEIRLYFPYTNLKIAEGECKKKTSKTNIKRLLQQKEECVRKEKKRTPMRKGCFWKRYYYLFLWDLIFPARSKVEDKIVNGYDVNKNCMPRPWMLFITWWEFWELFTIDWILNTEKIPTIETNIISGSQRDRATALVLATVAVSSSIK